MNPEREGNKFERMMRIIAMLRDNQWISGDTLAEKLKVHKRTLARYIHDINVPFYDVDGMDIIESSREGYKLLDTRFLDRLKGMDDYYTVAAIQTTPFGQTLNSKPIIKNEIYEKIRSRINLTTSLSFEKMNGIFQALVHNRKLNIAYRKNKEELKQYTILPLKLILNSGIYYLHCYDFGYNKLLNFTVNKIESMEEGAVFHDYVLISEKLEFINSRWGFMADDYEKYIADIIFETTPGVAEQIILNPLHESMTYEQTGDKYQFKLCVHNAQEFVRYSYRYGKNITIISPDWVIDIIKAEAKALLGKYEDNGKG